MSNPLHTAEGKNGAVDVYEEKVCIRRDGLLNKVAAQGHGEKVIRMDNITGIEYREGHLQINEEGFDNDEPGLLTAPQDANTVAYKSKDADDFEKARELIEDQMYESSQQSEDSSENSAYDELRLQFAKGEISEEEYKSRMKVLKETE